jgi:hypothetical protein
LSIKLLMSSLLILIAISLSFPATAMDRVKGENQEKNYLNDSLNHCANCCLKTVQQIAKICPSKKQAVFVLMVLSAGFASATANGTDCDVCTSQLAQCNNITNMLLNEIASNTQPVAGVDALAGYYWTIAGAVISLGGVALTPICDGLAGWWFSKQTETRLATKINILETKLEALKNDGTGQNGLAEAYKNLLATMIAECDNGMGFEKAKKLLEEYEEQIKAGEIDLFLELSIARHASNLKSGIKDIRMITRNPEADDMGGDEESDYVSGSDNNL